MIDGGYVEHADIVERFKSAIDLFAHDARASDLPRIVRNLNRVEEDFFDVAPTTIELPDWVD